MRCTDPTVAQVLVGMQRVGLVGLRDAVAQAVAAGAEDREAVIDLLLTTLGERNYIPDRRDPLLRTALWREYLRHTGADFSAFFAEVPVTITGAAGADRDHFVERVREVLAGFELRAQITFEPGAAAAGGVRLLIHGEEVAHAGLSRRSLETAVRHSMSDW